MLQTIKKIADEIGWNPQKSINDIFNEIFLWIHHNERALNNILNV